MTLLLGLCLFVLLVLTANTISPPEGKTRTRYVWAAVVALSLLWMLYSQRSPEDIKSSAVWLLGFSLIFLLVGLATHKIPSAALHLTTPATGTAFGLLSALLTGLLMIEVFSPYASNPAQEQALRDTNLIFYAQNQVKERLKDPDSAQFKDERVYNGSNVEVVCGAVNAKNSYGGYMGYTRFIAAGNQVFLESNLVRGEFRKSWQEMCRN